jgi:DNA polymerase-3 subunit beta
MKFIVSSSKLLKQLQTISGVINSSNTLPILDNILFEMLENKLTLTASDLETTMSTSLEVEANEMGSAAIPAKLLLDTLKTFPEQPLTFLIDIEKKSVEISSDQGKYALAFHNGKEFPLAPNVEAATTASIHSEIISTGINKTIFATGNDDLRPVMSGVFCKFSDTGLTLVSTDAHKLVRYTRHDVKSEQNAEFILPKKPLNLLKGILASFNEEVKIEYNETNAKYSFGSIVLTCRLIDGKYPNYNAVIPQENPNKLTIDRISFLNSVKRVAIFSNKTTHQIRLKIAGNEMHISAEDIDFSNKADERLSCQYEGSDMEIGFNSRFLMEMISNLETEQIHFEMSAPNRAGILLPEGNSDKGEDILMLVMPVMLNN